MRLGGNTATQVDPNTSTTTTLNRPHPNKTGHLERHLTICVPMGALFAFRNLKGETSLGRGRVAVRGKGLNLEP